MRLGLVVARFAQRAFWARLIALRPAADNVRRGRGEATAIVLDPLLVFDPRSALMAASKRPSSL